MSRHCYKYFFILLMSLGTQPAIAAETEVPARGTSKDSVREHFGPATTESTPIGDPPITRWRYPGMTVYFEYNHVLHTVIDDKDE